MVKVKTFEQLQRAAGNNESQIQLASDIVFPDESIVINKQVELIGDGYSIRRASASKPMFAFLGPRVRIDNLRVDDAHHFGGDLSGKNYSSVNTFRFLASGGAVEMKNVELYNSPGYAIYAEDLALFRAIDCKQENADILGWRIGKRGLRATDVQLVGCEFRLNSTNAVAITGGNKVTVNNCRFYGNHRRGAWKVDPKYGNAYAPGGQLYVKYVKNLVVHDSEFVGQPCSNCHGNRTTGIELFMPNTDQGNPNVNIRRCVITDHSPGQGIAFNVNSGQHSNTTIDECSIYGNTYGIVREKGARIGVTDRRAQKEVEEEIKEPVAEEKAPPTTETRTMTEEDFKKEFTALFDFLSDVVSSDVDAFAAALKGELILDIDSAIADLEDDLLAKLNLGGGQVVPPTKPPFDERSREEYWLGRSRQELIAMGIPPEQVDCDTVNGKQVCTPWRQGSGGSTISKGDFLSQFAGGPSVDPVAPPTTVTPPSSATTFKLSTVKVFPGGWQRSSSGNALWQGPNRYVASDSDIESQGCFNFAVTLKKGKYKLVSRARQGQPQKEADKGNDHYIRLKGATINGEGGFFKCYYPGAVGRVGDWSNSYKGEFGYKYKTDLIVDVPRDGNYTLQVSGRSNGAEIDYVEIVPVGGSTGGGGSSGGNGILYVFEDDSETKQHDTDGLQAFAAVVNYTKKRNIPFIGLYGAHWSQSVPPLTDPFMSKYHNDTMNVRDVNGVAARLISENPREIRWCAGGPMNTTAAVIQRMKEQGFDTKKVKVYQHSAGSGWNEKHTSASAMAAIKNSAKYVVCPNGNIPFMAMNQNIRNKYRDASPMWKEAIDRYWEKGSRIDFSDLIEMICAVEGGNQYNLNTFYDKFVK